MKNRHTVRTLLVFFILFTCALLEGNSTIAIAESNARCINAIERFNKIAKAKFKEARSDIKYVKVYMDVVNKSAKSAKLGKRDKGHIANMVRQGVPKKQAEMALRMTNKAGYIDNYAQRAIMKIESIGSTGETIFRSAADIRVQCNLD